MSPGHGPRAARQLRSSSRVGVKLGSAKGASRDRGGGPRNVPGSTRLDGYGQQNTQGRSTLCRVYVIWPIDRALNVWQKNHTVRWRYAPNHLRTASDISKSFPRWRKIVCRHEDSRSGPVYLPHGRQRQVAIAVGIDRHRTAPP